MGLWVTPCTLKNQQRSEPIGLLDELTARGAYISFVLRLPHLEQMSLGLVWTWDYNVAL